MFNGGNDILCFIVIILKYFKFNDDYDIVGATQGELLE